MDFKAKILLAEDDYDLGTVIKKRLEEIGLSVTHVTNGVLAWQQFQKNQYDLCLLDIIMPQKNGLELASLIRSKNEQIPILFLTAKTENEDIIKGFNAGVDGYISKPVSMQELVLRIDVFIRRTKSLRLSITYEIGPFSFVYGELQLLKGGKVVATMTQREADLLRFFCENKDRVLKRDDVLNSVWGKDDYYVGRSMDVFITKIRKHFKENKEIRLTTIPRVGFKFVVEKKRT